MWFQSYKKSSMTSWTKESEDDLQKREREESMMELFYCLKEIWGDHATIR